MPLPQDEDVYMLDFSVGGFSGMNTSTTSRTFDNVTDLLDISSFQMDITHTDN